MIKYVAVYEEGGFDYYDYRVIPFESNLNITELKEYIHNKVNNSDRYVTVLGLEIKVKDLDNLEISALEDWFNSTKQEI